MEIAPADIQALIREKYDGDKGANLHDDLARLYKGEPLAYVIGTLPFLGLTIHLDSHPLIPRPETEWWTEELIKTIPRGARVLDLCAGSGAIGLAILKHTDAHVSFGEISAEHVETIKKNIEANGLDASRAKLCAGDLFAPFEGEKFNIIATNPPYIPSGRTLSDSVTNFEPKEALYAGPDGFEIIERIIKDAPDHLLPSGALWMECDTENIADAHSTMLSRGFTKAEIRTDQYDRPRLLVGLV